MSKKVWDIIGIEEDDKEEKKLLLRKGMERDGRKVGEDVENGNENLTP